MTAALAAALPPGGSVAWTLALLLLMPPLVAALALSWRGPVGSRFAGVQLAGSVGTVVMAVMTFAFGQPSSIDLAVTFGILAVTASLLYAVFVERWV
ncbi:hypothetical protein [Lichenibacterium dinghuense]|uniref:hypothetical protein n=1 Tax=Lichenibacterium dinghuense TaxID=2895977 RepID=UPI001F1D08E0|nr:hypothetical protein [Lichenibacterium sp. 6Y81]